MPANPASLRQMQLDAIQARIFTEPESARSQCHVLLNVARDVYDVHTFIAAALQLSLIEDQLGDFASAINLLSESMAYAQEFRLFQQMPAILEQLGCCHYSLAHYPQALAYWQQCVLMCGHQSELSQTRGLALVGLGRICDAVGDNRLAVIMHKAGYQLLLGTHDPYLITMAQINWAVNVLKLADYPQARQLLNAALQTSQAHQLPHHAAECLFRLAQIALAQDQLDEAEICIEEGLLGISSTPYHWVEVNLLAEWAELLARQHNWQEAYTAVQRGLRLAEEDAFKHLEMRLLRQAQRYAGELGLAVHAAEYERRASFLHLHLHDQLLPPGSLELGGLLSLLETENG
ncbi:hypothetical protein ABHF33_06305 [Chitinibacter sp. FCG-7]|uniref:Tetratricopeptide repeat protein n=1 Tax=Chitinibacter mangrovi TaxID=3153927 RepID=A0AAU7FDP6_9NEIS